MKLLESLVTVAFVAFVGWLFYAAATGNWGMIDTISQIIAKVCGG